ncbi:hypothetical protein INR49_022765 [Caranx melampygus]|nr:hypothetical protein INR49_022765 [Caranx melampygus]
MNPFDGSGSPRHDEAADGGEIQSPWSRFASWLECVCVVTFDLELGQAIELVYPPDVKLTEKEREVSHFFGYVYFRQVKDVSVKRGYFQKVGHLSTPGHILLPYTHLFHSLLQIIAPEFFEKLEPFLEAVCNEIDQWPSPVPGLTLNLPVMGVVLQVRIPSKSDKPGGSPVKQAAKENLLPTPMLLPNIHELDLFKSEPVPPLIHI